MADDPKVEGRKFAEFLNSLSASERQDINQKQLEESEAEHREFQRTFQAGNCYLCGSSFALISPQGPCLHSLLRPLGIQKTDILETIKLHGFFRTQSYLRWVANQETFALNINDMPDEGTGKLLELTIKFKNLEWSFSCSRSDYTGHGIHRYPHFHFQMRIDSLRFIDFSDAHIPFLKNEFATIEALQMYPDVAKAKFHYGEGIGDILTDATVEKIINSSKSTSEENPKAAFKFDTIAIADDGTKIDGEDLYKIIEEAKANNVSIASLMHKLPNAKVRTIVTPGPGVVEQAPRAGGRSQKKGPK